MHFSQQRLRLRLGILMWFELCYDLKRRLDNSDLIKLFGTLLAHLVLIIPYQLSLSSISEIFSHEDFRGTLCVAALFSLSAELERSHMGRQASYLGRFSMVILVSLGCLQFFGVTVWLWWVALSTLYAVMQLYRRLHKVHLTQLQALWELGNTQEPFELHVDENAFFCTTLHLGDRVAPFSPQSWKHIKANSDKYARYHPVFRNIAARLTVNTI